MMNALRATKTGFNGQKIHIDVISQNLANVNGAVYPVFEDRDYVRQPGGYSIQRPGQIDRLFPGAGIEITRKNQMLLTRQQH